MSTTIQRPAHSPAAALAKANEIRYARADLHQQVKDAGREGAPARLAELLLDPPVAFESAAIGTVLAWMPRWGPSRIRRYCFRRHINELARIAGDPTQARVAGVVLTERQRRMIAHDLQPTA